MVCRWLCAPPTSACVVDHLDSLAGLCLHYDINSVRATGTA